MSHMIPRGKSKCKVPDPNRVLAALQIKGQKSVETPAQRNRISRKVSPNRGQVFADLWSCRIPQFEL
jgi:hypothetical protein